MIILPLYAELVRITFCENCRNIHIVLFDEAEAPLAEATLQPEAARAMIDRLHEVLRDFDSAPRPRALS